MAIQKKTIRSFATVIILMIAGGVIGFLGAQFGMSASKTMPGLHVAILLVSLIPVYFIVVGFHEGGHVAAGILMGFEFRMFVIGPFLWEKQNGRIVFKWNTNVNVSGGMAICLPKDSENLSNRFSIYAAGGPIASLIFSGFTFLLYIIAGIWAETSGWLTITKELLSMTSFLSLLIFGLTALPFHTGGFYSDGARVIRFMRGGDVARFDLLLLKIITGSASGTRPRDLSLAEIMEAKELAQKLQAPMEVYIHSYHYQVELDSNNIEQAEVHLQNYVKLADEVPGGIRNAVWLDAAFFYAAMKQDAERAEFYWKQFAPSALIPKAMVFATEAAFLWLKNDKPAFEEKHQAALRELPNMLDKGMSIALKDKLEALQKSEPQNLATHFDQPIGQAV
ncbi:MAG: M50 family metallopeptidase [Cyclobacteriaceae bacterium]|nr:M50 family metallopeptidase [Cyclobacteriaceae bacterium]